MDLKFESSDLIDDKKPYYEYIPVKWHALQQSGVLIKTTEKFSSLTLDAVQIPLSNASATLSQLNSNILHLVIQLPDLKNHPSHSFSLHPDVGKELSQLQKEYPLKSIEPQNWLGKEKNFRLSFGPGLSASFDSASNGERMRMNFTYPNNTNIYGLGEKYGDLDKAGKKYQLYNTDFYKPYIRKEPMYQSHPYVILRIPSSESRTEMDKDLPFFVGIFNDCFENSYYDLGKTKINEGRIEVFAPIMDLYLIFGKDPFEITHLYTTLTGRMEMPPLWTLGTHQCRWGYKSIQDLKEVTQKYRELKIPCDAIWSDIDYMDNFAIFTWHPVRFKGYREFFADLHKNGWHIVPIIDPGMALKSNYPPVIEGLTKDCFCSTYEISGAIGIYESPVWPPSAVFPDFFQTKVKNWWAKLTADFISDSGVDGIWIDMNEPAAFKQPDRDTWPQMLHKSDDNQIWQHYDVHNVYAIEEAKATKLGIQLSHPDKRPFMLTRAGSPGIQRYAAVWSGDIFKKFEEIWGSMPMLANLGLSGQSFVGADIGGFAGETFPPLLIRFSQIGVFYPFARNHSAHVPQEPWINQFILPETVDIIRMFYRFRYLILPYLYSQFWFSNQYGFPIWRPLFAQYPEDPKLAQLDTEIMVGEALLLAPICTEPKYDEESDNHTEKEQKTLPFFPDKRKVYLPKGNHVASWFDIRGNKFELAGSTLNITTTLEEMPIYVRNGSIIPCRPPEQTTNPNPPIVTLFYIFADRSFQFKSSMLLPHEQCRLYLDEGDGYQYLTHQLYNLYDLNLAVESKVVQFELVPVKEKHPISRLNTCVAVFHDVKTLPKQILINQNPISVHKWLCNIPRFTLKGWNAVETPQDLKSPEQNSCEWNEKENLLVITFSYSQIFTTIRLIWE